MVKTRRQTSPAWRATFVLLVLLFGALAPAVKLVRPTPVTCGMACCEASGVCYCEEHYANDRTSESSAERNDAPFARLEAAKLSPACPSQCAQLPVTNQKQASAKVPPPRFSFVLGTAHQVFIRNPQFASDRLVSGLPAPRAPPSLTHKHHLNPAKRSAQSCA